MEGLDWITPILLLRVKRWAPSIVEPSPWLWQCRQTWPRLPWQGKMYPMTFHPMKHIVHFDFFSLLCFTSNLCIASHRFSHLPCKESFHYEQCCIVFSNITSYLFFQGLEVTMLRSSSLPQALRESLCPAWGSASLALDQMLPTFKPQPRGMVMT